MNKLTFKVSALVGCISPLNTNPLKILLLGTLLAVLAACSAPKPTNLPAKALGLLKVTISGVGEGASPGGEGTSAEATAQWVGSGVRGQTSTVVPVGGTNALGDVELKRRAVSFYDDDANGIRYVQATFDITNRSTTHFSSLTFFAVNVPGNIGGTAFAGMASGSGAAIPNPETVARGFMPTHGMRASRNSVEVHPTIADLQFFTNLEVVSVKNQATIANILPADSTVLAYGFVARGASDFRSILSPNAGTPSDCTSNACKGRITLAFKFPKVSPRSANPFTFSLYFVVSNEIFYISQNIAGYYASQSVEEQSLDSNTIAGEQALYSQTRVLAGSHAAWARNILNLCQVRIAVASPLNPSNVFLPSTGPSNTPGSLDDCGFGAGGKVFTNFSFGNHEDRGKDLVIQPNGKIVVVGDRNNPGNNGDQNYGFALARYNSDGSLDPDFGNGGQVATEFGTSSDSANAVALQSDGKIVAVGTVFSNGNDDIAIARYNTDGSLDGTFGIGGKVITSIGSSNDIANSVAIQADGKILVAGSSYNGNDYDFALVRYTTGGLLDNAFSSDGKVTTPIGSEYDEASDVVFQADGKIVVVGYSNDASKGRIALARYNQNGLLDTSFSADGKVTTAFGLDGLFANAVAIQSDGKIVVAGFTDGNFLVARYGTSGTLDTGFGFGGLVFTSFTPNSDVAESLAIQSDGKIVVGGYSNYSQEVGQGPREMALARYNTNGSLDASFGSGGKVTTRFSQSDAVGRGLAIQADGKIVLAGYGFTDSFDINFAVARYNP